MAGKVVLRALVAVAAVCATPGAAAPPSSDLEAVRLDPASAPPGGRTVMRGLVSNLGPDRTASSFRVIVTLPAGFAAERPYFPSSCADHADGRRVICTFPAGLPKLATAITLVPVRLKSNVSPGTEADGHVRVVSRDDRGAVNNRVTFTLRVSGVASGQR